MRAQLGHILDQKIQTKNKNTASGAKAGYCTCPWRRRWHPLQSSRLENPMEGRAWWAAVHGVAEGRTRRRDFTFTFHLHALEKEMATHSSVLDWRIPGTGEPGGLPSMGSHRVGHDCSSSSSLHLFNSFNWFIHLTLKLCVFLLICFLLYAFISLL